MVGHDNTFPLKSKEFLTGRLYTWIENEGMGQDQSLILGTIPIHLLDALPSFFGFSLQTGQKIIYVFWFFAMGLSCYIFAYLLNPKSRFFRLFAAIFYQFNFFILQGWWIFERTKFSAYIALPLVLSICLLVHRRQIGIIRGAILNSFVFFFFNAGGLYGIPLYGGLFLAVFLFILFFSFLSWKERNFVSIKRLWGLAIFTIIGVLLLNSYWIIPAAFQLSSRYLGQLGAIGGVSGVLTWVREISIGASFLNLFRLQGIPEWYDNPQHPYAKYFLTNPILIAISFIFSLLVFGSLLFVKEKEKTKFILYFFLVWLLGIFFAAGTHPPFGFVYQALIRFIPGFAIFRTPFYKFSPAVFFSAAFLSAYSLDFLKNKLKNRFFAGIFSFFWISLVLAYHYPYFTGEFLNPRGEFSNRLKIPKYVFDFADFVEKEKNDDYRILMLPQLNGDWHYELYHWGYLSLTPLPRLFTNQAVIVNDEALTNEERGLFYIAYESLKSKNETLFKRIATDLRIKYLLLRLDFFWDYQKMPTDNPHELKEIIVNNFHFPLKQKFGEWELYEISGVSLPPVLSSSGQIKILDSPGWLVGGFYQLLKKGEPGGIFVLKEKEFPSNFLQMGEINYITPRCLNCRHDIKFKPSFPEIRVLPDSSIYPFLLLKEKWQVRRRSGKAALYDEIGLSLKRVEEFYQLVIQKDRKKKVSVSYYLEPYRKNLERMLVLFEGLTEEEEKFETAEDLNIFLEGEKDYLSRLLGRYITEPERIKEMKDMFGLIESVQKKVEPWLIGEERGRKRVYFLKIDEEENFEILLNKESLKGELGEGDKFWWQRKGKGYNEVVLSKDNLENDWISLGEQWFEKGNHQLTVELPPLKNLAGDFHKEDTGGLKGCFFSEIKNYNSSLDYKIKIKYVNDFSDILSILIKKDGNEEIFDLPPQKGEKTFEYLLSKQKEGKSVTVAICSPQLTEEILKEKITLEVSRIIHPVLILRASRIDREVSLPQIEFKKVNPTKYLVEVKNSSQPFFLVFWQRFSPNWSVSIPAFHFRVNNFANGWLIEKEGDFSLELNYLPQKRFYQGLILSGIVFLTMSSYLLVRKNG